MKSSWSVFFLAGCIILFSTCFEARAQVEGTVTQTLKPDAPPMDAAASLDGKWLFVLTQKGEVQIWNLMDGKKGGSIHVGAGVNRIATGPREDILYLSDAERGEVRILVLDFINNFDYSGSPSKGPEDAPVVITLFTDFECAYCAMLPPILEKVLQANPKNVRLVFKNFPLNGHEYAISAAAAAIAAGGQGKFWEFHDKLFQLDAELDDEKIMKIAADLKLDAARFNAAKDAPETMEKIRGDWQAGYEAGVNGTPALFINGRKLRRRSLEDFQEAIDKELRKFGIKK
ncbi:MAG: thioredoxin domain-containing protein [Desulfobacterales bacterium]|nr:thioredoxin domain-containing protein [Desulfobacterales bacterium]